MLSKMAKLKVKLHNNCNVYVAKKQVTDDYLVTLLVRVKGQLGETKTKEKAFQSVQLQVFHFTVMAFSSIWVVDAGDILDFLHGFETFT